MYLYLYISIINWHIPASRSVFPCVYHLLLVKLFTENVVCFTERLSTTSRLLNNKLFERKRQMGAYVIARIVHDEALQLFCCCKQSLICIICLLVLIWQYLYSTWSVCYVILAEHYVSNKMV